MTEKPFTSSPLPARLTLLALLSATAFCFWKSRRLRNQRLSFSQNPTKQYEKPSQTLPKPKLFFASQTGTSKTLALRLSNLLSSHNLPFDLVDPKNYEPEDLPKETLVLIVASTWEDGNPPPNAGFLARWLAESADDFRVGSLLLSRCRFAVFGVGSRLYGSSFNAFGKEFSRRMRALGAFEILPLCEGDVDGGDLDEVFDMWSGQLVAVLERSAEGKDWNFVGSRLESGDVSKSVRSGGSEDDGNDDDDDDDDEEEEEEKGSESGIVDLEDIAGKGPSRSSAKKTKLMLSLESGDVRPLPSMNGEGKGVKEMVTPIIRTNLEKQVRSLFLDPRAPFC